MNDPRLLDLQHAAERSRELARKHEQRGYVGAALVGFLAFALGGWWAALPAAYATYYFITTPSAKAARDADAAIVDYQQSLVPSMY